MGVQIDIVGGARATYRNRSPGTKEEPHSLSPVGTLMLLTERAATERAATERAERRKRVIMAVIADTFRLLTYILKMRMLS